MVAALQWIGTSPRKLLWTPAGRLAMAPDCCCVVRDCARCPPGTVPPFLLLTFGLYGSEGALPPVTVDCSGANVLNILLEHDPDITVSLVAATEDEPICAYRYLFPTPVSVPSSTDIYGWGAELVDFQALVRINLYPLGFDGGMWKGGTEFPQDWTYWLLSDSPQDCDTWEAGYFSALPGLSSFSTANSDSTDPNCFYGNDHTLELVPYYP